jgi:hypothetical protein
VRALSISETFRLIYCDIAQWEEIEGSYYDDEMSDSEVYTQDSQGDRGSNGAWYLGKAREEFQNRQRNREWQNPQGNDEDDHVQVCAFVANCYRP